MTTLRVQTQNILIKTNCELLKAQFCAGIGRCQYSTQSWWWMDFFNTRDLLLSPLWVVKFLLLREVLIHKTSDLVHRVLAKYSSEQVGRTCSFKVCLRILLLLLGDSIMAHQKTHKILRAAKITTPKLLEDSSNLKHKSPAKRETSKNFFYQGWKEQ